MPQRTTGAASNRASGATYTARSDLPFTVIDRAEADALFAEVQTCTSPEGGYTVSFPASWHTNEGGEAPECSWFAPAPFASAGQTMLIAFVLPKDIPIQLGVFRGGVGSVGMPQLVEDEVVIGGLTGYRTETFLSAEPQWVLYAYGTWLEAHYLGLKFSASASSTATGDYVLHKAVLDRMMTTIEFAPEPPA